MATIYCVICSAEAELPVYKNMQAAKAGNKMLRSGSKIGFCCVSHNWEERKLISADDCADQSLALQSEGITLRMDKILSGPVLYGINKDLESGQVRAPAPAAPAAPAAQKPAAPAPAAQKPAAPAAEKKIEAPTDTPKDTDAEDLFTVRTVVHTLSSDTMIDPADKTDIMLQVLMKKLSPSDPADQQIVDMLVSAGKLIRKVRIVSLYSRFVWIPDQTTGRWVAAGSEINETETVESPAAPAPAAEPAAPAAPAPAAPAPAAEPAAPAAEPAAPAAEPAAPAAEPAAPAQKPAAPAQKPAAKR